MERSQIKCIAILNKQKCLFFFFKNRTGRQNLSYLGIGTSGRGEDIRKGCGRVNVVEYYVHIHVNGKMRLVETVPGMGEGG
jgi:hypothetical protein